MRLLRARDDEQPRRVAVEPVDDPGPLGLVAARDRVAEQPVDERPAPVAGRRMDDDARRACRRRAGARPRRRSRRSSSSGSSVARRALRDARRSSSSPPSSRWLFAARLAVDETLPLGEQPLGGRARADLLERREEPVEPLARRLGRHGERQLSTGLRRGPARVRAADARLPLGGDEGEEQDATPMTMKVSARLNAGQKRRSRKSVTWPMPQPVDEVAEAAADQQAERDRQHRMPRARRAK